jgi:glycerol-3-phosphate dehydrogenase
MSSLSSRFNGHYDLLVVGAGITGSGAACAAARSGLRVALIDSGDFGGGASSNSLKVIHGGLRYLQHLDICRMRESIRARSLLLHLAPGLVKPRGFVMPLHGWGLKGKPALSVALGLNDLISMDRNRGFPADHHIPNAHLMPPRQLHEQFPFLATSSAQGGAAWYDAVAEDTERVTLCFALDAELNGATLTNYVKAVRLIREQDRASGIEAHDVLTGETCEIRSRHVLWTGGSSLRRFDAEIASSSTAPTSWVRAVNLVLDVPWPSAFGLAAEGKTVHHEAGAVIQRGKRNLFFVPWRKGVMVGTWYVPLTNDIESTAISSAEIDTWVNEVRSVLPGFSISRDHVSMVHSGILPATPGSSSPGKKTTIAHGPAHGLPDGFTLIQAVKYTTGPFVGAAAVEHVARRLGKQMAKNVWKDPLARAELPPADISDDYIRSTMANEHARTLADVLLRRTGLGTYSMPGPAIRENVARVMGVAAGWTRLQIDRELKNVSSIYRNLGLAG